MAKRESVAKRKERAQRILDGLHELYAKADCALKHRSAFELLVATILSAQSTDETVNKVTPALFRKYPTAADLAKADLADVEDLVRATGFFRQKAKNIVGAARAITGDHGGKVPADMDALTALPGVARKTANVVLGTWLHQNVGVVVDTHVGRLADRLALTWTSRDPKDAIRIEQDLMQIVPQDEWTYLSHALIWHGRRVCTARKPNCPDCRLAADCPSAGKVNGSPARAKPAKGTPASASPTSVRRKARAAKAAGTRSRRVP
ncbi:MAG TPA: endonuclease III [Phycisphaerae bacterium]|nr:endonuclease III [Phycisphaerae bacterium]